MKKPKLTIYFVKELHFLEILFLLGKILSKENKSTLIQEAVNEKCELVFEEKIFC